MSKGKILVVDDEPQILTLVSRFLRRVGYDVEAAYSGAEAIELLKQSPFALVLSDLKMPEVDGLQILEEVHEHHRDTIFILMTAFGTIDSAVSVLRRGAYDYLTKPLELDDLLSTVERALEHRMVVMQNRRLMEFLQEKNAVLEQLHREEQRRAEQLDRVNAIARQITPILDLDALVEAVVQLVSPAFAFRSFSFGLVAGETLVYHGGKLDGRSMRLTESACWKLTEGGRQTYLHSPSARKGAPELVYPLRAGERVIGFWVAEWGSSEQRGEQSLPYLEALAAQTVAAVENARLYALARRADELAFLNEVALVANQSLDLDQTIHSVLLCVRATFNASLVEICLWGEDLRVESVYTLVRGTFQQDNGSSLGDRFCSRVREDSIVICSGEDAQDLSCISVDGQPMRSLLGVGLHFGTRQIGCLGVASANIDVFGKEDARLLQVVGGQVSTAIQNARLFDEIRSSREMVLQSRNTLQALFDGILDGIYVVDRQNKVLAVNRTQARWAKRLLDELVGGPAALAFPNSVQSPKLIVRTFEDGQPVSATERQPRPDGEYTEWEIQTYPVAGTEEGANGGHSVDRVVVVVRDVTAQRMLEASLARSEKLAAVGRLAAGIAHEINNPMTVISANAQILREELSLDHPYYRSAEMIDRASERATKIVRNLLDFSRAEQFEFMETDLNRSLEEAVLLAEIEIHRTNIAVSLDLAPDLPPVWASPDHLQIVWLNMLLNARDAIEETGREGKIQITSALRNGRFVVQVSDNGIGIPGKELNRIYDPFFTTKPPGKGTGLGLFTCYRTIHRHGGEIHVSSQLGVGTTFEILLPLDRIVLDAV
jgi:signal transduction histidine kinase/DNA-binding response OmpR family regulator